MVVGSGATYLLSLMAARLLAPGTFGAFGSLLALLLIASVPALALQMTVARHVAIEGPSAQAGLWRLARRRGLVLGGVLGGAALVAALPLADYLRLESAGQIALAGAVLVPQPVQAAAHGVLQGRSRFRALAVLLVVSGVTKLGFGLAGIAAGYGLTGALAGLTVAAVAGAVLGVAVVADHGIDGELGAAVTLGPGWQEIASTSLAVAGLMVLANIDMLLARHHLSAQQSGIYAAGATLAKVVFWAPQFVSVIAFPRLAAATSRHESGRTILASSAAIVSVSAAVVLVVAVGGERLSTLLFGGDYVALGPILWLFAALGTVLASLQLLVLARVARDDRRIAGAIAAAVIVLVALLSTVANATVGQVVTAALGVSTALLAVSVVLERSGRAAP